MITETATLCLAGLAGAALSVFFFGGLWWTVRKGMVSPRPALWFIGSLLVRTPVVLVGFYLVGQGDWKRLTASLAGFIVARLAIARITRPPELGKDHHAP